MGYRETRRDYASPVLAAAAEKERGEREVTRT